MLGLGRTGTDVNKGDAEWTDGRRKPRCCEKSKVYLYFGGRDGSGIVPDR